MEITTITAITTETFKLEEYTANGVFSPFRYVSDSSTQTIWYLGDEGQIIATHLTPVLWDMYLKTGQMVGVGEDSEYWDEEDLFKNLPLTDKAWAIIMYLCGMGMYHKNPTNRDKIAQMWRNYQKGYCVLSEAIQEVMSLI